MKYPILFQGLFTAILLLGVGCAAQPDPAPDPAMIRANIETRWSDFTRSWNNLDADACAAFFTENARNIGPEVPVREGRAAIGAFYTDLFGAHQNATYRHEIVDLAAGDGYAVEFGRFTVDWLTTDSTAWQFTARSLTYWVEDTDGIWRIASFMFNKPPAD